MPNFESSAWEVHSNLAPAFPHGMTHLGAFESKLRQAFGLPHRPNACLYAIAEWLQPHTSPLHRIEKMVHRQLANSIFLTKMLAMNYTVKHRYLDHVENLKVELQGATRQSIERVVMPMATFLQIPPLIALHQVKYHATRLPVSWADYHDLEDEVLVNRIDRILKPYEDFEVWPLVVVLIFEGSQINVVDLYVRERSPDDTRNFVFETK